MAFEQDKVLEVKDLRISFYTDNGILKAVRGVSFDLERGETLCIVGESGSGKSVTSKAIMGILANNSIIEGGSILYEGENLLEISEEEFHRIRGKKIGMIFQDPLSSLNPIVRIGKQITEATLINGDKLKKMYNEIITPELVAFKNAQAQGKIAIKKAKDTYLLKSKEISGNTEYSSDEIKEIIAEAKAQYKSEVAQVKAELKEQLPPLKQALKEKQLVAKAEVKEYKNKLTSEHKEVIANLKAQLAEAEDKQPILDAINAENEAFDNSMKITKKEAKRIALDIMREVGIPEPERRFKQYPFEFSGGMRQRIVIAIALIAAPDVLICDEPTTALDVTIQAQILELINRIKKERNLSCIFITHDLGVVANMADRVAVMYAGKIVEHGTAEDVFFDPRHPYTWALLSSIPDVDSKEKLDAIPGTPPNMIYPPKGDAFALRSKYAMEIDFKYEPPFFKVSDTHYAATWLLDPRAPKVEMPAIVKERIKNALKEDDQDE